MAKMYLYGGEQDGADITVPTGTEPVVYYAVPHEDQPKIEKTKGIQAKVDKQKELATLAYEFRPDVSDPEHLRMFRNPALDKVTKS